MPYASSVRIACLTPLAWAAPGSPGQRMGYERNLSVSRTAGEVGQPNSRMSNGGLVEKNSKIVTSQIC